jgi:hypothetical protein
MELTKGLFVKFKSASDHFEIYRRFVKSAHFPLWLQKRSNEAYYELHRKYHDNLWKSMYLNRLISSNETVELMKHLAYLKEERVRFHADVNF